MIFAEKRSIAKGLSKESSHRPYEVFATSVLLNNIYADQVSNFSRRALSVEADAHAAFSGAARLLEIRYRAPLFYGLPSTSLHTALLWNHAGPAKQRLTTHGAPPFPSWSWLGWNGPVTMSRQNCSWRTLSRIKWINPEDLRKLKSLGLPKRPILLSQSKCKPRISWIRWFVNNVL
jgi:hypothetical protein